MNRRSSIIVSGMNHQHASSVARDFNCSSVFSAGFQAGDLSWVNKLKVVELKEELRARGLKISGQKAQLQARLTAAIC